MFDRSLKRRLIGAMRVYPDIDDATGDNYTVYEYWTDKEVRTGLDADATTALYPHSGEEQARHLIC